MCAACSTFLRPRHWLTTPSLPSVPAPVPATPGRTFPVDEVYLPAAMSAAGGGAGALAAGNASAGAAAALGAGSGGVGGEDYVAAVVRTALRIHTGTRSDSGDVLCFVTGMEEVERACVTFTAAASKFAENAGRAGSAAGGAGAGSEDAGARAFAPPAVIVLALHGPQPPEEQQPERPGAFAKPPPGHRKVIFATSVAETSITIDGVR